jgi:hypothetical protein
MVTCCLQHRPTGIPYGSRKRRFTALRESTNPRGPLAFWRSVPISWTVLTALLFVFLPDAAASAEAPFTVEWKAGRLSVSAERAPLLLVLREVARQTGIEIQGLTGLHEQISVRFARLGLREAIEKLLAQRDYAILGDPSVPGGRRPARVVISGRRAVPPPAESEDTQEAAEAAEASEPPRAETGGTEPEDESIQEQDPEARLTAIGALAREGNEEALQQALRDPDPAVQATAFELLAERDSQRAVTLLTEAAKSEEPTTRLQALQLLQQSGRADEATTLAALRGALADEAVEVKQYAIQALAAQGDAEALDSLRQSFLREADPAVRVMILESVAQQEEGLALLREATRDKDEAVRSFATFWLEQLSAEAK